MKRAALVLAIAAAVASPAYAEITGISISGTTITGGTISGTTISGVSITGSSSVTGATITGGTIDIGSGSFTVDSSGELIGQGNFYLGDTVVGFHLEGVGGLLYMPHLGANCGPSECYLKVDGTDSGRVLVSLTAPEPIVLQRQVDELRAELAELRAELAALRGR